MYSGNEAEMATSALEYQQKRPLKNKWKIKKKRVKRTNQKQVSIKEKGIFIT